MRPAPDEMLQRAWSNKNLQFHKCRKFHLAEKFCLSQVQLAHSATWIRDRPTKYSSTERIAIIKLSIYIWWRGLIVPSAHQISCLFPGRLFFSSFQPSFGNWYTSSTPLQGFRKSMRNHFDSRGGFWWWAGRISIQPLRFSAQIENDLTIAVYR